jgi:hypothetical protein
MLLSRFNALPLPSPASLIAPDVFEPGPIPPYYAGGGARAAGEVMGVLELLRSGDRHRSCRGSGRSRPTRSEGIKAAREAINRYRRFLYRLRERLRNAKSEAEFREIESKWTKP